MDFDNGDEFINRDMFTWATERAIYSTRSRPYRRDDQATIDQKNNRLACEYAYRWCDDPPQDSPCSTDSGSRSSSACPVQLPQENPPVGPAIALGRVGAFSILPAHFARKIDRIQQKLTAIAKPPSRARGHNTKTPPPHPPRGGTRRSRLTFLSGLFDLRHRSPHLGISE